MKSFVKKEETSAPTETLTTAVATVPPKGSVGRTMSTPYFEGEMTKEDLRKPFLSIVHNVGPKSAIHQPGTVLLGENTVFKAPGNPQDPTPRLRLIFTKVVKDYVQNLPYDPTPLAPRPQVLRTQEEVFAAGGTLNYVGQTPPSWNRRLITSILVRCPQNCLCEEQFQLISGEHAYTLAATIFQKTSYAAAKTLLSDLATALKGNPLTVFYDLWWVKEKKGQNIVWVAKLALARDEKPDKDVIELAQRMNSELSFQDTPADVQDSE